MSRPPVSTPALPRAAARPRAAASSASDHDAGCSTPSASRSSGDDQPVGQGRVGERPASLVAVPLLVDLGSVAGQPAGHGAAAVIGALTAPSGAVLADARRRDQVEGPGAEPVGGPGQRADRADLHGVAGEVGVERHALGDADLLLRPAIDQFDQRVAGDLVGEPGAPGALDAALAVQQHLRGQRDRLGERALAPGEPGLALAGGHGLVLQRALTALVAHRAVERVVDQQHLHDTALGLLGDRRGQLRPAPPSRPCTPSCRKRAASAAPPPARGTAGRRRWVRAAGGRRTGGSGCRAARRP